MKSETQGRELSVVLDGTTRLGEAVAILARYVTGHVEIQQQLQLARELISVLSVNYSVSLNTLLAAMRDRASINNVALKTLKVVYPFIVDAL